MQIAGFEFIPYVQDMFKGKEQSAIFVFRHVSTNNHFACRYWDASRFSGEETYPMALTNALLRHKSDVEVFVLVTQNRTRKAGESIMNKVVVWLMENNLYRGQPSRLRGGTNVIDCNKFMLAAFKHVPTGAVWFAGVTVGRNPKNSITGRVVEMNHMVFAKNTKGDILSLFATTHFPLQVNDWDISVVSDEAITSSQLLEGVEKVSVEALECGEFVLNRIRSHSPLWYFNNLYRGKNITAAQYVQLGSEGNLAKNRQLQNPKKVVQP